MLTIGRVAKKLRISDDTIRLWEREKKISFQRNWAGRLIFYEEEFQKLNDLIRKNSTP